MKGSGHSPLGNALSQEFFKDYSIKTMKYSAFWGEQWVWKLFQWHHAVPEMKKESSMGINELKLMPKQTSCLYWNTPNNPRAALTLTLTLMLGKLTCFVYLNYFDYFHATRGTNACGHGRSCELCWVSIFKNKNHLMEHTIYYSSNTFL